MGGGSLGAAEILRPGAAGGEPRPQRQRRKQYEGLRKKGMNKSRAVAIANTPDASSKGGKRSGGGGSSQSSKSSGKGSGGNRAQKQAGGRKGGKNSH
jgi:hypothetical protein